MSSVQPVAGGAPLSIRRSTDAAPAATARLRTAPTGAPQRLAAGPVDATGWVLAMAAAGSSDTTLSSNSISSASSGAVGDGADESVRAYIDAQFRITSAVRDAMQEPLAELQAAATALTKKQELGETSRTPAMILATVKDALEGARKVAGQARDDVKAAMAQGATEAGELASRIAQWNGAVAENPARGDLHRRQEGLAVRLARLVGAQAQRADDGTLLVSMGTTPLVAGTRSSVVEPRTEGIPRGSSWSVGGAPVAVQGELGAATSTLHRVLPDLDQALQEVAQAIDLIERNPAGTPGGEKAAQALTRAVQEVGAWADGVEQAARGAGRIATMAHVLGKVFSAADPGLLHDALFSPPPRQELSAQAISHLQDVNHSFAALGRHAGGAEGAQAAGGTAISSAPEQVHARVSGITAPATLDVKVLSVASGPTLAASRTVAADEKLAGAEGARLAFTTSGNDGSSTFTVAIGPFPRIEDVAAAINNSGGQVRATMVKMGGSAYQLRVTSLVTGRSTEVVVTDGQQPPSTSTIMGKFTALEAARETVAQVDITAEGEQSTQFVSSPDRTLRDVWPGVTLIATDQSPQQSATIDVTQDAAAAAAFLSTAVKAAGDTLTQARTALGADMPQTERGAVSAAMTRIVDAAGTGELPGIKVHGRGRDASVAWDAAAFSNALQADPVGTARAAQAQLHTWSQVSQQVSDPSTGVIPDRLRWSAPGASDGDVRAVLGADDPYAATRKHADALHQSLRQLSQREQWLGQQLQSVGAS